MGKKNKKPHACVAVLPDTWTCRTVRDFLSAGKILFRKPVKASTLTQMFVAIAWSIVPVGRHGFKKESHFKNKSSEKNWKCFPKLTLPFSFYLPLTIFPQNRQGREMSVKEPRLSLVQSFLFFVKIRSGCALSTEEDKKKKSTSLERFPVWRSALLFLLLLHGPFPENPSRTTR